MAKTGKLVMIRMPGQFPRLQPATAVAVDGSSGQIIIEQEIELPDGHTNLVPKELCFEFDPQVMEAVNSLVGAAADKLSAAQQILALELEPAEIESELDGKDTIYH
jgi:hypothetical protein